MILLSLQDRATLLKAVTTALPIVQSKPLRDMLLLMAALLHDYAKLEQRTQAQLHVLAGLTVDIRKMTVDLHNMVKNDGADTVTTAPNALLH